MRPHINSRSVQPMSDTAAWASLIRVYAAVVPALDAELRERCRIQLTWYDVLLELHSAEHGRLTMSDLGRRAVVSRSQVSRVVGALERAGLVVRHGSDDDGRSVQAHITPLGTSTLRDAAPVYLAGIEREFTRHLGKDAKVVARALQRVLDARVVDFGHNGDHG